MSRVLATSFVTVSKPAGSANHVLVVTGGEALYGDMGHFGVRPIRLAWTGSILPFLVLGYL